MDNLEINIAYPQHPIIKKYVDYYYVLNPKKTVLHNSYLAYPNIQQPLIFFENTDVRVDESMHLLQFNKNASWFCGVLGRFLNPLPVTLQGNIRTINIIFNELGLNSFINVPYSTIISSGFQVFNCWNIDSRFIAALFSLNERQLEIHLDQLLLKHYCPFANLNLTKAIELMRCETEEHDVKQIAEILGVNRKTLLRLFIMHTGISPTAFRRIVRFRQALNKNDNQSLSLTQLAYNANFCDQSHFIKELHKLTGDTPSSFIKQAKYVNGSKFLIKPQG